MGVRSKKKTRERERKKTGRSVHRAERSTRKLRKEGAEKEKDAAATAAAIVEKGKINILIRRPFRKGTSFLN